MNGAGGAAGTLLGGIITQEASWRWVLLINVPIAFAAVLAARIAIPERRAETRPGVDLPGALILTTGLLVAAYGAVTAGADGWGSASALVPIVGGSAVAESAVPVRRAASRTLAARPARRAHAPSCGSST